MRKKNYIKNLIGLFSILVLLFFSQCKSDPDPNNGLDPYTKPIAAAKLTSPNNEAQFIVGDELEIGLEVNTPEEITDLKLFLDDVLLEDEISLESQIIALPTDSFRVGYLRLKLSYKDGEGKEHADTRKLIFFSDLVPSEKSITVNNTFPHLTTSYTQGLEFYQGELYEGTGHYNKSILAKVDLNSGTLVNSHDLPSKYFGEGITILNDTIYQITWNEHVCLIYDMDFNKIGQFEYTGEGWGLTNDGKHIIMTNGSSEVVWRNPKTFAIEKRLQVFDDEQEIVNLNECEMVNGRLLINVYTESYFIEVDTATGKMLHKMDCSSIVNEQPIGADHLNGLAYNNLTKKLYLTGKWWPKMYQISIEGWDD